MKTDTYFMSSIHYKQTHTGLYKNCCSNLPDSYEKVLLLVYYFVFILFAVTGLSLMMSLLNCVKCLLSIFILHTYLINRLTKFCLKLESTIRVGYI